VSAPDDRQGGCHESGIPTESGISNYGAVHDWQGGVGKVTQQRPCRAINLAAIGCIEDVFMVLAEMVPPDVIVRV
jgi:hypothetical protein